MKTVYCCPYCKFETLDPREWIEHIVKFHDYPNNPPEIKSYVIIRIEYP